MKKIPIYAFFFLLCFFLLILSISSLGNGFFNNPSVENSLGSTGSTEFIPMDDDLVNGEVESPSTSYLRIQGRIVCNENDRNPQLLSPWGDEKVFSDNPGSGFPMVNLLPLSFLYGNLEPCTYGEDISFMCSGYPGDYNFRPWPNTLEPNLIIDYHNFPPADQHKVDVLLNRYEGDCGLSVRNVHIKEPDLRYPEVGGSPESVEYNPNKYYSYVNPWSNPISHLLFSVSWDTDSNKCALYGGNWLDTAPDGAKCCGDDWIWLYNTCLYSKISDDYTVPTDDCIEKSDLIPNHLPYDQKLALDDSQADEVSIIGKIGSDYYFAGVGDTETDIGKWSNDLFCNRIVNADDSYYFKWMTIQEAADTNALICEAYLGYNWTGSKCCLPSQTYNDTEKECNAKYVAQTIANDLDNQDFSSIEFENAFSDACEDEITSPSYKNRACFEGRSVENNDIIAPIITPDEKSIYNKEGIIYKCDDSLRCTIKSKDNTINNFVMCAYTNNSWYNYYTSTFLGFQTDLAKGKTYIDFTASAHDSVLPAGITDNLPAQNSECCLLNSCWNGTQCVEELSSESVYHVLDGVWSHVSATADFEDDNLGQLYICVRGKWLNTDALYNWYHDVTVPGFCDSNQSCVCSGTDTTGYDYNCGAANVKNDCTIKENFYIGDHYCQSIYDNSGKIAGAKWSSRTKLLAAQLVDIVGGIDNPYADYTLFCDEYKTSLNYIEPLSGISEGTLNSFCVIESDPVWRIIGTTFNIPSESSIDNVMFNDQTGFANVKLGANIGNCDNAIISASTAMHGSFKRCNTGDNKLWYNNKTQTIIYSNVDILTDLSLAANTPDYNAFDYMIASNVNGFTDFVDATPTLILPGLARIKYATDFNKFYISNKGGKKVFGVIETKYDNNNPPLSKIMAIRYTGFNLDCADIKAKAKPTTLECGSDSGSYYVMAKGSSQASFNYWSDLTAKLRFD